MNGDSKWLCKRADSKQIAFSGKVTAPELPAKIGAFPLIVHEGPVTATLSGNYSAPEKSISLNSFQLVSASGTVKGSGSMTFNQPSPVAAFHLIVRDLPPRAV